jgi:VanZ family protein
MDLMRVVRYWGPLAFYAAVIFTVSAQSHPDETLPSFLMDASDKLLHVLEYAIFGALCYRAFRWGATEPWRTHAVALAVAAASAYGMTDEIHQWFVPYRESSWQDWVADTLGGMAGVLAVRAAEGWWMGTRNDTRRVYGAPGVPREDAEEIR